MKRLALVALLACRPKAEPPPPPIVAVVDAGVDAGPVETYFATGCKGLDAFVVSETGEITLYDEPHGLALFSNGQFKTLKTSDSEWAQKSGGLVAVDRTHVYWSERMSKFGLWSAKKDGSEAKQLEEWIVYELLSDANALYVLTVTNAGSAGDGTVMRVPKSGGAPVKLTTVPTPAFGSIAIDDDNLYWAHYDERRSDLPGAIKAMPKTGGPTRTLAKTEHPTGQLAVDSTHVYWANNNAITRVSKKGGEVSTVAAPSPMEECLGVNSIALDGGNVYFTCSQQGTVWRTDTRGSAAPKLLGKTPHAKAIATDLAHVYFSDGEHITQLAK